MADILVGRGVRRRAPTIFDLIQGPATAAQSALGAMGSAAKGAAQATVGLPGDVESLVRMITGGEQTLPTTEQVGQFVNQYIRAPYPQYEKLGEFTGLPTAGALTRPATQLTNEAADALVRAITGNPQATAQRVIQETAMPFALAGVIQKAPNPFTVVHGTKQPFTEFQSGMGVTAKDIYTVPENFAQDASGYGQTLIKATASPKKMIDFSDFDKLDEPTVKAIKKAAKDSGITDKYYTFDQFKNDLMNGQMYQVGGGQSTQNAFLAELFTKFDAVKMPDARVGGGVSQSVVFQNPKLLQVKEIDNLPVEEWKKRKSLLD